MLESENIHAEESAENIAEGAALQKENLLTKTGTDSLGTTANDILQNDDMEVHKHPHHVTHKKKWGEYLLEFFMLFLAVFLGFVAENIREHNVERQREKEYIESLIADLKSDQQVLEQHIVHVKSGLSMMDSMLALLNTPS